MSIKTVNCYYKLGHTIIGNVVDILLEKDGVSLPFSVGNVSGWADTVKFQKPWSRKMHYISSYDSPPQYCGNISFSNKSSVNLYNSLTNYTYRIIKRKEPLLENFYFFIHLYQDLFQPLHMSSDKYRGGNNYSVIYRGKETNLHTVWDNLILRDTVSEHNSTKNFIDYLVNKSLLYTPKHTFDYQALITSNNKINCNNVYIFENNILDDSYYITNRIVVENLLIRCSVNLANALKKLKEFLFLQIKTQI
ncbi:MAG TPA: S1/P1 nuclease [Allocoleopsis sp.]